jgi:hypothetical protein
MAYNNLKNLINRYNSTSKSKGFSKYSEIPASKKWAEYSIDEVEIRRLMQGADFIEKFGAEKALSVVRRKIDYMYKHPNYNINEATAYYKKLKRLLNY